MAHSHDYVKKTRRLSASKLISVSFLWCSGDPISSVAIACKDTHAIHIFNARGDNVPIHVVERLHGAQIAFIKYSPTLDLVISGKGSLTDIVRLPKNVHLKAC